MPQPLGHHVAFDRSHFDAASVAFQAARDTADPGRRAILEARSYKFLTAACRAQNKALNLAVATRAASTGAGA